MIETVNNIFLGILGMNMVIVGIVLIVVTIVMLVRKQKEVTHILSMLYIVLGPFLVYFGFYLARKYLWHSS